jgi:hypothetical protein
MLSKGLYAPLLGGALIFLYLAWDVDPAYSLYIIPFVIGLAVVYILSPQIDWWWYQRRPPALPAFVRELLNTRFPFYQQLGPADKERFRIRTALYMKSREFIPQGMEAVPVDLQGVIAATAVQLTFGQQDFLKDKFEHIVVYPHPFPSPQYPEHWHASEIYEEDGVIMFSAEQLLPSFLEPQRYFHIGLYEFARVYRRSRPGNGLPEFSESDWPGLEAVSGLSRGDVEKWVGLPSLEVSAVAVVFFLVFPARFRAVFPAAYEGMAATLNIDFRQQ